MASENPRMIVLDMLLLVEKENEFSNHVLRDVLQKYQYLSREDRAFIKRLYEGVLERRIELDYRIDSCSKIPARKMKPIVRNSMRMGVYQIHYMDKVPNSAACDETVKLVKKRGLSQLSGFVNATMRALSKTELALPANPVEAMSIRYSFPRELLELLITDLGEKETEGLLEAALTSHALTIRMDGNLSAEKTAALLQEYRTLGMEITRHPYYEHAYRVEKADGIDRLPGWNEGIIYAQDVSSMLVCAVAGIRPGMQVLDVCAAPGGKSLHAASLLNGEGKVYSRDLTDYKTDYIRENAARSPYDNIEVKTQDATIPDENLVGKMDVVLVDAPCSGLGVLGKKPDIKYHTTPEAVGELAALQRTILNVAKSYVKPGGVLIYSTCTVTKAEDEENVSFFLEDAQFTAESIEEYLPKELRGQTGEQGYLKLIPGAQDSDGFFLARFRRKE